MLCKLRSCWHHSCTGMESYYGYIYIRIGFCLFGYDPIIIYNVDRFFFFGKRTFDLGFDTDFFRIFFLVWVCAWLLKFSKLVILILIKRIWIQNPMVQFKNWVWFHVHNTLSQDSLKIVLQLIKINQLFIMYSPLVNFSKKVQLPYLKNLNTLLQNKMCFLHTSISHGLWRMCEINFVVSFITM